MMNDVTYKAGGILSWICALSSEVLLLLWLAMAATCRLALGHWPQPMIENFNSPTYALLEGAMLLWGYFTVLVAGPTCLIIMIIALASGIGKRSAFLRIGFYGIGWALLLCAILFDPTTFSEWFID
jgi:hypothetical protein